MTVNLDKRTIVLILLFALLAHSSLAGAVIWDVIGGGSSGPKYDENDRAYYELSFGCSISGEGFRAYIWTACTFTYANGRYVISPLYMDISTGKYLARTEQGDVIDADSVRDEKRLFTSNWGYDGDDIVVPRNGSFMLGFEVENDMIYDPDTYEFDKMYGWAIFQFDGTSVSVTSSALVVGADGIYAGTGIVIPRQIPEPGVARLLCVGAVVFLLRRGNLIFALSHNSTIS